MALIIALMQQNENLVLTLVQQRQNVFEFPLQRC